MCIRMMSQLKPLVLIFGGSSGIGRAAAFHLSKIGYTVFNLSRSQILDTSPGITNISLDLRNSNEIIRDRLDSSIGNLDIHGILYCASDRYPARDINLIGSSEIIDSIKVSTLSLSCILQWLIDRYKVNVPNNPSIIVMSSKSSRRISPHSGFLYCHSKASQACICRYYAKYLREHKIGRINLLTPDLVDTPMSRNILGDDFIETVPTVRVESILSSIEYLLDSSSDIHSSEITINSDAIVSF